MREVLYSLWWRIWLCEPEERACLEVDLKCFKVSPPTDDEIKAWRARALRYNRVFYGVPWSAGIWGAKRKRRS